ncbi:MAG: hypothetical protein Q8M31_12445, partial [Beijerinckiaceae bacterium]|nr:hypothetical protein [Beijerinckiaceae bacterium]
TISRAWQAAALRGAAVREHMVDAFNPNRWFAKATKDECVAAIVAMDGRNTCEAKKIAHIRDFTANLATDRKWLPPEIARHLPAQSQQAVDATQNGADASPSLAQAMAAAIDADQSSDAPDVEAQPEPVKPKRGRKRKASVQPVLEAAQ